MAVEISYATTWASNSIFVKGSQFDAERAICLLVHDIEWKGLYVYSNIMSNSVILYGEEIKCSVYSLYNRSSTSSFFLNRVFQIVTDEKMILFSDLQARMIIHLEIKLNSTIQ